jgi:hypothetical protein
MRLRQRKTNHKPHYKGMSIKEIQPGHQRNPRDNTGSSKVDKELDVQCTPVNCYASIYYIIYIYKTLIFQSKFN